MYHRNMSNALKTRPEPEKLWLLFRCFSFDIVLFQRIISFRFCMLAGALLYADSLYFYAKDSTILILLFQVGI
jgi:hypothetical protein